MMKYLSAFLNSDEISLYPQGQEPIKPIQPVKSVLSVCFPRGTEKLQPAQTPSSSSRSISAALDVFPDWQGISVKSAVLGMSVWVVRDPLHGIALAKETGYPALLLDDILRQKGQTTEEARAALLPLLITVPQ